MIEGEIKLMFDKLYTILKEVQGRVKKTEEDVVQLRIDTAHIHDINADIKVLNTCLNEVKRNIEVNKVAVRADINGLRKDITDAEDAYKEAKQKERNATTRTAIIWAVIVGAVEFGIFITIMAGTGKL